MNQPINVILLPRSQKHETPEIGSIEKILEQFIKNNLHFGMPALKHKLFVKLTSE